MGFTFDPRTVAPQTAMVPVPDGWYKVVIKKSNIKPTAKGDGSYLELYHEVIEGQFTGRPIWWNLNLFNPNAQTVDISFKQLSAICHCIGHYNPINSQDNAPDNATPMLHNQPYYIWVITPPGSNLSNVKGCKDIYGNDPGKQGAPTAAPQGYGAPAPAGMPTQPGPAQFGAAGGTAPGGYAPPQAQGTPAPTAPGGYAPQPAQAPQGVGMAPGWGQQPGAPAPAPVAPQWQGAPQPGAPGPAPQPAPQQWAPPAGAPQAAPGAPAGAPGPMTWTGQGPTQAAPVAAPAPGWQQGAPGGAAPWIPGQR